MRYPMTAVLTLSCLATPADAQGVQQADPVRAFGLDQEIQWIADPETYVDGRRAKRNITGKLDRAAMLDGAIAKAKKSGRPVLWYVYRIVEGKLRGRQMYRAPVLDCYMQHVLFADPDVSSIINSRFVPLRMVMDESASKRFGLRPLNFIEPAVIFIDGEGEILHYVERFRTFNAHWFGELMRRVLAKAGATRPKRVNTEKAIAEGRWEMALEGLTRKRGKQARDHYRIATLLRRLRNLDAADKALAAARKAPGDLPPGVLTVEAMRIRTMRGKAEFEETAGDIRSGQGPRTAEGLYLLAVGRVRQGDHEGAKKLFESISKDFPDDPYGRKAKVNITEGNDRRPMGPTMVGYEHMTLLPDATYAGLQKDTQWTGKKLTSKAMAVQAIEFLLSQQRGDGGFTDSRYAYWPRPEITTNTWVAITALAATALHQFRDVDPQRIPTARIDAAIAKARQFMFDQKNLNRGKNEDVYADTYRLVFLANTMARKDEPAQAKILAKMNDVIGQVQKRQKESGFWAHEYQNAFCSAAMLWGLVTARNAGADVPEEMLTKGVAALLSARFKNGAYTYGGSTSGRRGRRGGSLKDSSARMPVCEGALHVLGKSDLEKVTFAFDTFWKFIDRIEKVRRNDFHSDGELAGFFFFHALYHASEVNKLLPEKQQADNRRRFMEILQRIPEMDGSFIDSHEFGRSYGTAMALLTLQNSGR